MRYHVGVVVGGHGIGVAMAANEVDQLTTDLQRRKPEKVLGVVWRDGGQSSIKAKQSPLEDVVGLLPAADPDRSSNHPVCQRPHAVAGDGDKFRSGSCGAGSIWAGKRRKERPNPVVASMVSRPILDLAWVMHGGRFRLE